jgi:hypothetical protein
MVAVLVNFLRGYGFMFGGAPTGRISAWVLSFRFTTNSKPPVTVMRGVELSRLVLVIGFGALSSDRSARSRLPSSGEWA